ncbi:hypothetical protein RHOER0001_6090 [Rhodococcus erythropolis SK121]|nr:hypothetical protein RHOER0001_6090 [Rhodococcus erythropolis SK121]
MSEGLRNKLDAGFWQLVDTPVRNQSSESLLGSESLFVKRSTSTWRTSQ